MNVPVVKTYTSRKIKTPWFVRNTRTGGYLRYELVEKELLENFLLRLTPADLFPKNQAREQAELLEIEAQIRRCEERIGKAQARMQDLSGDDFDFQQETALALVGQRRELVGKRDAARAALATVGGGACEQAKSLVSALAGLEGDELRDCRVRLRGLIRQMVKRIDLRWTSPTQFDYAITLVGSPERFHFTRNGLTISNLSEDITEVA